MLILLWDEPLSVCSTAPTMETRIARRIETNLTGVLIPFTSCLLLRLLFHGQPFSGDIAEYPKGVLVLIGFGGLFDLGCLLA